MARGDVDDQPLDLTAADSIELLANHLQVPVRQEFQTWMEFECAPVNKGIEVRTKDRAVLAGRNLNHGCWLACWRILWITCAMTSWSASVSFPSGSTVGSVASAFFSSVN